MAPLAIQRILNAPATLWAARIAMASPFAISAIAKLLDPQGAIAEASGLGLGAPALIVALTVATQALGSGLLLTRRWCWLGAGMLAVFTVIATLVAHAFWRFDGTERAHQMATLFEHVAIVGGFAAVAILVNGSRSRE